MPDTTPLGTRTAAARGPAPSGQDPAYGSLTITFDRSFTGFPVLIDAEHTDPHGNAAGLSYRTLIAPRDLDGTTTYVAHFPRVIVPPGGDGGATYYVSFSARSGVGGVGSNAGQRLPVVVTPNAASEVNATRFRSTWL